LKTKLYIQILLWSGGILRLPSIAIYLMIALSTACCYDLVVKSEAFWRPRGTASCLQLVLLFVGGKYNLSDFGNVKVYFSS
jgi:hypothetical protein